MSIRNKSSEKIRNKRAKNVLQQKRYKLKLNGTPEAVEKVKTGELT